MEIASLYIDFEVHSYSSSHKAIKEIKGNNCLFDSLKRNEETTYNIRTLHMYYREGILSSNTLPLSQTAATKFETRRCPENLCTVCCSILFH